MVMESTHCDQVPQKIVNMDNAYKAISRLFGTSNRGSELEMALYLNKRTFMSTMKALAKIVCPFRKGEVILLPPVQGKSKVRRGRVIRITSDLCMRDDEPCLPYFLNLCTQECGLYKIVVELLKPDRTPQKNYKTMTLSYSIELEKMNGKTLSPTIEKLVVQVSWLKKSIHNIHNV